jgi:uncharacterized protein YndB with AHSA1/START domain
MTDADTEVVEQTLRIEAAPETVWRYWTDPERLTEWWGAASEVLPRPGGDFVVEMRDGPVMRGEFVELVPYERLVFTFGWDPLDGVSLLEPGSTRVEVTLTPDGGDTILTLRHSGLPPGQTTELHRSGWSLFLPLLAEAARA